MTEFKTETFDDGPLTVKVAYHYDTDPWTDWIGEFSSDWAPGAIDRKRTGHWRRNEYEYFIPTCTPTEVEANRVAFSRMGFSRHEAWLKATRIPRHEHELMEGLSRGDWSFIGLVVTCYIDGLEVASRAAWGIEDGYGPGHSVKEAEKYHKEVIADLLSECKAQLPTKAAQFLSVATILQEA